MEQVKDNDGRLIAQANHDGQRVFVQAFDPAMRRSCCLLLDPDEADRFADAIKLQADEVRYERHQRAIGAEQCV